MAKEEATEFISTFLSEIVIRYLEQDDGERPNEEEKDSPANRTKEDWGNMLR